MFHSNGTFVFLWGFFMVPFPYTQSSFDLSFLHTAHQQTLRSFASLRKVVNLELILAIEKFQPFFFHKCNFDFNVNIAAAALIALVSF